jgi:lysophospholipase L1-like esterase
MADPNFQFDPPTGHNDTTEFLTNPPKEAVRGYMQRLHDQTRDFINNTLMAWIKETFLTPTGDFRGTINGGDVTLTEPGLSGAFNAHLAESAAQFATISNIAEMDYKALLEQNFWDLLKGNVAPLADTEIKNEAKTGTVTSGALTISGTHANLKRVHSVKSGTDDVFENIDYTVDLLSGVLSFPDQYSINTVEETGITFTGANWVDYTNASLSGGTAKYITEANSIATPGQYAEYTFTGTFVNLITRKSASEGIVKITIDGGTPAEYDLYAAATAYKQKVVLAEGLSNTSHTVRIEHANTHNVSATGNLSVFVDALEYGTQEPSVYEGLTLSYKVDYLKYQGALDGISTAEGEDKFRFKILHAPDYAYFITDKNIARPLPLGQATSIDYAGSEINRLPVSALDQGKNPIRSGLKIFVKYTAIDAITRAYTNLEVENTPQKELYENYGTQGSIIEGLLVKPCLVVVTDKCMNPNFEVGEVALAVFAKDITTTALTIETPRINLFKLNNKIKFDMVSVVAYGDSITADTYVANNNSFCEKLETMLSRALGKNINVINKGDNGDKSTDLITTMYQVTDQKPNYVIIATGANDQGYEVLITDYRNNLITMINTFRAAGISVLLMNMPHVDYPTHYSSDRNAAFAPYMQVLSDLSTQYDIPYIDYHSRFASEIANGNWDLFMHYDGTAGYEARDPRTEYVGFYENIHPNIYGLDIIAEEIADVMIPLLTD